MSKLFTRRPLRVVELDDPASAYSSLLDADRETIAEPDLNRGIDHHDYYRQHHQTSPPSPTRADYSTSHGLSSRSSPQSQSVIAQSRTTAAHRRTKSYVLVAGGHSTSSWLGGPDSRRASWTGERREIRKLQKDPSGSARPSSSLEISDSDGTDGSGGEKDKGSVRRKMERLRGLYRKGEK